MIMCVILSGRKHGLPRRNHAATTPQPHRNLLDIITPNVDVLCHMACGSLYLLSYVGPLDENV